MSITTAQDEFAETGRLAARLGKTVATAGALVLTSATGDKSDLQTALTRLSYTDTTEITDTATKAINLIGVNDPSTIEASNLEVTSQEQADYAAIDRDILVGDVDSDLAEAKVSIADYTTDGAESLALTAVMGDLDASWDQETGVLTISGIADAAEYQNALRAVGCANISDAPPESRSFIFTVTATELDPATDQPATASATKTIAIERENDAPTAGDDDYGIRAGTTMTAKASDGAEVLRNGDDPDGDAVDGSQASNVATVTIRVINTA